MKTNDLIALLASDTLQPQKPVRQQLFRQLVLGAVVCGVLWLTVFGLNPQMDQMAVHPAFISKMLWLTALMAFSLHGLFRLARPGVGAGHTLVGLGLALVKTIAQRHGGSVSCEGALGGGASFVFRLPQPGG